MSPSAVWCELSFWPMTPIVAASRWGRNFGVSWIVVGGIAIAAVIALWLFSRWWLGEGAVRRRNSPRALFAELCRAHGLAIGDRQLLLALADTKQLVQPGELFVSPEYFDEDNLAAALATRKAELRLLKRRLFEGLESPADGSNAASDAADADASPTA